MEKFKSLITLETFVWVLETKRIKEFLSYSKHTYMYICKAVGGLLALCSLTSVCIFSILLPRHIQGFWQWEFVQQSRASLVGDHLLYSHDLNVWFRDDVVKRN